MGTDIYHYSAMILENPEVLLDRLDNKNKRAVIHAIANGIKRQIKQHIKESTGDDWHAQKAEKLQEEYRDTWLDTSREIAVKNLKDDLMAMLEVDGEPGKYETEINLPRQEEADLAWGMLIKTLYPEFPLFKGFSVWGSGRYNGGEVPLGVPCATFSQEECFERVMTATGKAFERVTGIDRPTEWTEISY